MHDTYDNPEYTRNPGGTESAFNKFYNTPELIGAATMTETFQPGIAKPPTLYKKTEHVRANVTDDGLVILDIDKGEIFSANCVAADIWNALMGGYSEEVAVDKVVLKYEVDREIAARDTDRFITSLVEKDLIEVR
jgi:hypothetical protein